LQLNRKLVENNFVGMRLYEKCLLLLIKACDATLVLRKCSTLLKTDGHCELFYNIIQLLSAVDKEDQNNPTKIIEVTDFKDLISNYNISEDEKNILKEFSTLFQLTWRRQAYQQFNYRVYYFFRPTIFNRWMQNLLLQLFEHALGYITPH